MARVVRVIRKERCSAAVSLLAATIAFPGLLVVAGLFMHQVLIVLVDCGFRFGDLPESVVIGIVTAVAVIPAYLPSRLIYTGLRWSSVEMDSRCCESCGYNLTGNISGVCPECGVMVPLKTEGDGRKQRG